MGKNSNSARYPKRHHFGKVLFFLALFFSRFLKFFLCNDFKTSIEAVNLLQNKRLFVQIQFNFKECFKSSKFLFKRFCQWTRRKSEAWNYNISDQSKGE